MANEFYRKLLGVWMPIAEGGYNHAQVTNGRANDQETLFGIIDTNLADIFNSMSSAEVSRLSPGLARHARDIKAAPNEAQRLTETREMMRDIARNFATYDGSPQPATGQPRRATGTPLPGRTAAQMADIESMRGVTADALYQRYVQRPGFNVFPDFIEARLVDFAVNKGNARARWGLAEALHDTGLMPDSAYNRIPHLTDAQVVDLNRNVFSSGPGAWFASTAANDTLLPYTRNLTPAQQDRLVQSFNQHRIDYHHDRGRLEEGFERFVPGLDARVQRLERFIDQHFDFDTPAARAPARPAPQAPARATPQAPVAPVTPAPQRPRASYPDAIPSNTAPNAPAGERVQLEVQFRVAAGSHVGGRPLLDDAIAIEIPGRGVFTYAVNKDGAYTSHYALPTGVELLHATARAGTGIVPNPYPQERTLTWLDNHGHRHYVPLSEEINTRIREGDINYIRDFRTGIGSIGPFQRDAAGLKFSESDLLVIEQTRNGPRFSVVDMDRQTNGNHPTYVAPAHVTNPDYPPTPPAAPTRR